MNDCNLIIALEKAFVICVQLFKHSIILDAAFLANGNILSEKDFAKLCHLTKCNLICKSSLYIPRFLISMTGFVCDTLSSYHHYCYENQFVSK